MPRSLATSKSSRSISRNASGHVDAAMTLNVYGHLIKERQAKAREGDGGILGRIFSKDPGSSTPALKADASVTMPS